LQWCSVFLKCLLHSKLSLKKQDNYCYHRSSSVIISSCCYALLYFWKLLSQIVWVLCFVDPASRYNRVKKNQLDAQLILSIYFINLYKFLAYLGPPLRGTTVCVQQLVLIMLFRWLSVVRWTRDSHLKRPKAGLQASMCGRSVAYN
jgi:hypothetical protein